MLDRNTFKTILKDTPLVSIDICLIFNNKMLLGRRSNEPLKGQWFTPGGRILKNESWQDCLRRVAQSELGFYVEDIRKFTLMGIWNHFYTNSAVDENISTHYVNLPHFCFLEKQPILKADEQHDKLSWFDLEKIKGNGNFHEYIRSFACKLINKENK